uniref:limulus clotting factor C n=1 Tax=Eratigena atrica TaxID=1698855 RepID=A0A2I5YNW8_9ARAC|nr:putative PQM protease precursor [Eratigena atrica]
MMLLTLCLLFLVDFALGKVNTVANCGKRLAPQGRIVGGKIAKFGDYPWMVSIQEKNSKGTFDHICGGSIINENWIVTAAHCFNKSDPASNYRAYVGLRSILKTKEKTVQRHEISKFIIHCDYDDDGYVNDIALVKTTEKIDIKGSGGYVNGICLPSGATTPSGTATVIGWGLTKYNGSMIELLKEATLPIVSWQTCKQIYGDKNSEFDYIQVTPAMLCAGGQGEDACQNDSGGPLFQTDDKGVATLIGTVANGAECAYKHYPGMYMKVSAYLSWMEKHMK